MVADSVIHLFLRRMRAPLLMLINACGAAALSPRGILRAPVKVCVATAQSATAVGHATSDGGRLNFVACSNARASPNSLGSA